jgi:hypothetical protein
MRHNCIIDFLLITGAIILVVGLFALINLLVLFSICDGQINTISVHQCKITKIEHICTDCVYFVHVSSGNDTKPIIRLDSIIIDSVLLLTNHTYTCWKFSPGKYYWYVLINPFHKECEYKELILRLVAILVVILIVLISISYLAKKKDKYNEQNICDTSSLAS